MANSIADEPGDATNRARRAFVSPSRVEALSDGVFAVALTLLTFDLVAASKLPEGEHGLIHHLLNEWPTPMAYMVGFLTILVCWLNHRYVFAFVEKVDSGLLWLNGLQLALVAAVPLPTSILAENVTGDEARDALLVYGITFFLMAASFFVISWYVIRWAVGSGAGGDALLHAVRDSYGLATAWTAVCLLVAWLSVYPALVMWALMFGVFAFPRESSLFVRRRFFRRGPSLTVESRNA